MGDVLFEGKQNNLFYISFAYDESKARHILHMLETIIIDENPVIKNSRKLCTIIRDLVFKDVEGELISALNQFVGENGNLIIEGYIKFRLWEYSYAVNVTLYSIVKKLNLPVTLGDK
jgi:hypothetical protein